MKNLVLLTERRRRIPNHDESILIADFCQVSTIDRAEAATVLLTTTGQLIEVSDQNEMLWQTNLDDLCEGKGGWFDVTFLDPEIVCLSRNGAIVTVNAATGEANLEGEFENGLEAGGWSPDGEILLLVTLTDDDDGEEGEEEATADAKKNCVLLTMNTEFEVLAEVSIPEFVPSQDAPMVTACWQTDGSQCAVSSVDDGDKVRYIRIYDRENLQLKSVGRSEDGSGKMIPNLQSPLSWAGSGCSRLLASVQKKSKKTLQIVFFEANGLRHRECVLRHPNHIVQGLCWNVESDLLAVGIHGSDEDRLQLWHRSNYHWYLKYEFMYPSKQVAKFHFHEESPYIFFVSLDDTLIEYQLQWDTSTLRLSTDSSPSCIATVIDGCDLKLSPFDKALVPPPMSAVTVTFPESIREISFHPRDDSGIFALCLLADNGLCLLHNESTSMSDMIADFEYPTGISRLQWDSELDVNHTTFRQFMILGGSETVLDVVAISCKQNHSLDTLVVIKVDLNSMKACVEATHTLEDIVLRMVPWSDGSSGSLIELINGSMMEFTQEEGVILSSAEPLLEPCPWITGLKKVDEARGESRPLVIGLSARSRLYCHDRLLASSSSSFKVSITHGMLCYVSGGTQCQLRSLPLIDLLNFDPLMGADENEALEGYEVRNVERGSRLVAVVPSKPTAVLQMPRGNLEGIYPRSLVLPHVMSLICEGEYGAAFLTMRRQKVDLNLLVDLAPETFVAKGGAERFIEQVKPIDYINLFIASLQNFNITETRHKIPDWLRSKLPDYKTPSDFDFTTKVNQVCGRLRQTLLETETLGQTNGGRTVGKGHFVLPILCTFAKESPPKLEEALGLIRDRAFEPQETKSSKSSLLSEETQGSIQYLAFLADYELLYKTALGMYDFDLARAVARNSQMDPKVYLAHLKRLRSLPEFYSKYEVDLGLERYEQALANLHSSSAANEIVDETHTDEEGEETKRGNTFEDCLALVEKHGLYESALKLYTDDEAKRNRLLLSLGERLMSEKKYRGALSIFLTVQPQNLERAKEAARKGEEWRMFFSLSEREETEDENVQFRKRQLAHEIAQEISSGTDVKTKQSAFAGAARVLLDYGQDVPGAVDMLISAEMWSEGHRVAKLHSRPDLIRQCSDAVIGYAQSAIVDFEERRETFIRSNQRYSEVLKIRKDAIRESGLLPGEQEADPGDSGSLFSLASNASLRSDSSRSSVGSVASVSSVISASVQTTFSVVSEMGNRHKSKFNEIGKGKKKSKKKKKPKKKRMLPGSEEELASIVNTLKVTVIDTQYCGVLAEGMFYLTRINQGVLAKELFNAFQELDEAITKSQHERLEAERKQKQTTEPSTMMGLSEVKHPCEDEVNALACAKLPYELEHLFSFLG